MPGKGRRVRSGSAALLFGPPRRSAVREEIVIGVDEVGRGPLIGPVTVCAVYLRSPETEAKDSKRWKSERDIRRRNALVDRWRKQHVYALAWRSAQQINGLNILRATMSAVVEAVLAVYNSLVTSHILPSMHQGIKKADENGPLVRVLVDGDNLPTGEEVGTQAPNGELEGVVWESVVSGDNTFQPIAAASMIAKKARDDFVLASIPDPSDRYGFAENKGYGTAKHLRAIVQYGLLPDHRIVFTAKWLALHEQYRLINDSGKRAQFLDRYAPATWAKTAGKRQNPENVQANEDGTEGTSRKRLKAKPAEDETFDPTICPKESLPIAPSGRGIADASCADVKSHGKSPPPVPIKQEQNSTGQPASEKVELVRDTFQASNAQRRKRQGRLVATAAPARVTSRDQKNGEPATKSQDHKNGEPSSGLSSGLEQLELDASETLGSMAARALATTLKRENHRLSPREREGNDMTKRLTDHLSAAASQEEDNRTLAVRKRTDFCPQYPTPFPI